MPSAYAYFRVSADELPLDEISKLLESEPTESWRKGDPGQYTRSHASSGWCLHSPLPRTETDLRAHINALAPMLRPHAEAIRSLGEHYETHLVCVGYYDRTVSPGLYLSREVVALVASLNLAIDADPLFRGPLGCRLTNRWSARVGDKVPSPNAACAALSSTVRRAWSKRREPPPHTRCSCSFLALVPG